MSKYTTGEIARLCGVSVRTVQYYDTRNILVPSALSEGGRRLYSEDDLKRMRIICFLREAGLPINSIGALLTEEHPERIISILLDQQEQELRQEISAGQKKLEMVEGIQRELKELEHFSVDSIGDIAQIMKHKKTREKMILTMVLSAIPVEVLECAAFIFWIATGIWWPFAVWTCVAIPWAIIISRYYYTHVSYICPECHEIFKPRFKEMFWAYHTPKMRRLTCPKCGQKGLCIEVYTDKESKNNG